MIHQIQLEEINNLTFQDFRNHIWANDLRDERLDEHFIAYKHQELGYNKPSLDSVLRHLPRFGYYTGYGFTLLKRKHKDTKDGMD